MRSKIVLFGLIALFLSGCVRLDISQKVDRDGSSLIIERIDLNQIDNSSRSGIMDQVGTLCANMTAQMNCSIDNGIVTLTMTTKAEDGLYNFSKSSRFPDAIYTLRMNRLPAFFDNASLWEGLSLSSDFNDPSSNFTATTLKTAKANITYTIEMPGELIEVENGELVVDNETGKRYARYDILELMSSGKPMVVRSKETDTLLIGSVGFTIVMLIGMIVVGLVLLKVMKQQ